MELSEMFETTFCFKYETEKVDVQSIDEIDLGSKYSKVQKYFF